MKKGIKLFFFTVFASLLTVALLGCGGARESSSEKGSTEQKPTVINIGFQVIPNDEIVAKAKGWYEQELGVKVNFVQFDSGRDVNTAMIAKSIDIGLLGSTPASVGISKGIPYEVFWIHDVIGDNEALAVKNSANVNTIKDLQGKKIAVPFGSTTHYSLLNALKNEGIDINSVKILDMQPPDILAAWQRGDIDGAYVWQPTLGKLITDGKLIITSRQLAEKGIVTADVGVVRKEFAEQYPNLVAKYVSLQQKAYEEFKNNPDSAAQVVAKEFNINLADSKSQMNELIWLSGKEEISSKYLGTSNVKGDFAKTLKSTADFLVEQKTIESAPQLEVFEKAVNPQYIEKTLQK